MVRTVNTVLSLNKSKKVKLMKRKLIIIIVAIVIVAGGAGYGVPAFIQNSRFITTENASIGAPLISVSSLSSGQVMKVAVGIGDRVQPRQTVAELGTPRFSDSVARQGFSATPGSQSTVEAPVAGYVAAVWTYQGAIINAGSPIITLFDDSHIWVTANIDENKIKQIRPGEEAEVTVDSLGGAKLKGKVEGIAPATASSFSLLPSSNTSANFTKVSQVVPVRITLDNTDGLALIPGSSVEVKIRVK
jgi:multidrug resistance efflux pump